MQTVNIHEAKTHLSKLIERTVTSGESFIIAKAGKPLVRVTAIEPMVGAPRNHRLDFLSIPDGMQIPEDFDTMFQDEIIRMFEGEG